MANKQEEQVKRIQIIENPRGFLENLANSTSILRLFLTKGDEKRYDSRIPLKEDKIIKVLATRYYEHLLSSCHPTIPKGRATEENSLTFVEIAPKFSNQKLDYFWHSFNSQNKPDSLSINSFGGDINGAKISLSNGICYEFLYTLNSVHKKENFDKNAVEFNLSEFGWGDY